MGLWIEENFCANHVIQRSFLKVNPGHVVKVLYFKQDRSPCVVNIEEALQVGKRISLAQRLLARIRQAQAIALRELENHLGFKRAFNVDVQLGFWDAAQQLRQAFGGNYFHVSTFQK